MKPWGVSWEYKVSKMHIHGPGGKFETEVNAAENQVATCMVQLRSEFEGGEVTVEHRDDKMVIQNSADKNIMWAFSTDCLHSSTEVTSGWRAVMQLDIYETSPDGKIGAQLGKEDGDSGDDDDDDECQGKQYFGGEFEEEIRPDFGGYQESESAFLPDREQPDMLLAEVNNLVEKYKGTKVGLPLFNKYIVGTADPDVLRQPDRRIYEVLSSDETLKVTLRSVIHSATVNDDPPQRAFSNVMTVADFFGGDVASTHLENAEKPITLLFTEESNGRLIRCDELETGGREEDEDFKIRYAYLRSYLVVDRVE